VADLLTYGAGTPRYLALWVPLAPLLAVVLRRAGASWTVVAVALATTVPTLALHAPPVDVPPVLAVLAVGVSLAGVATWLVVRVGRDDDRARDAPTAEGPAWAAVAVAVLVVLLTRVPLAWLDPGISDIPRANELAVEQLLDGRNPWVEPNPESLVGTFQYPAGSVLAHLPFVAVVPAEAGGEAHLGARAALWATDVAVVVLLGVGLARAGRSRAGGLAALAYALHPTLVRESGLTVANDVIVAGAVAAAALALARRRPLLAAVAVGLAISVKPSAAALVPLVLLAAGWRAAAVAIVVPVALQLPFLLWPSPGLWGLAAMLEPAARASGDAMLERSLWAALSPTSPGLLQLLTAVDVLVAAGVAAWAGWRVRGSRDPGRTAAAVALPLLVLFLLSTRWQLNFQDWYLTSAVLAIAAAAAPVVTRGARRTPGRVAAERIEAGT